MTKAISRFEVNLLRVLRGLVTQAPAAQVLPMLLKPLPRPKCLCRDAVELVQDTLAKGCVQFLARRGWMRERFLRDGKVADGRLWERSTPESLGLAFSRHALELVVQLTCGKIGTAVPKIQELSVGDRLLLLLAFNALRHSAPGEEMRKHWLPLQQDGLCRLAFLDELPEGSQRFRIDWSMWTTGLGASIIETMQGWLADRWIEVERKKEKITAAGRMRKLGATQTRVFGEYFDALAHAGRRDLARGFLDAAARLLQDQPSVRKWIGNVDVSKERMADRQRIHQEALAFLRQLERLREWQQQAVGVGYFDDDYQASQLWKADWERQGGDALCERAGAIVREVEPL